MISSYFNRNNNFKVISRICHQHKLFHEKIHQQTSKKWWFWFLKNSSKFWKLKLFCASFYFRFLINTQETHGKFTRFFNQTDYKKQNMYYEVRKHLLILKVRQSQKQIMVILSAFCSFFGRIEETMNCFQDLLNFIKTF